MAGGRRQFFHLMTTSNHRPYTYPDERIDIGVPAYRDRQDVTIGKFLTLPFRRQRNDYGA